MKLKENLFVKVSAFDTFYCLQNDHHTLRDYYKNLTKRFLHMYMDMQAFYDNLSSVCRKNTSA